MERVRIFLAGPPRAQGRGRAFVTKHGQARVYTPGATRTYESQLRYAAEQAMGDGLPTERPVAMYITVAFAIPAGFSRVKREAAVCGELRPAIRPDADNFLKTAQDCLNGIIYRDDKQVVDAHVRKFYSERPGLAIVVEELPVLSMASSRRKVASQLDLLEPANA